MNKLKPEVRLERIWGDLEFIRQLLITVESVSEAMATTFEADDPITLESQGRNFAYRLALREVKKLQRKHWPKRNKS